MIQNLMSVIDGDILFTYQYDGREEALSFSSLKPLWDHADASEVEDWFFQINGNQIIGYITVAEGQGGIAFIWDAGAKKIVHISNAEYAVSLYCDDCYLYTLSDINYWGKPSTLALYRSKVGIIDPESAEEVKTDIPEDLIRDSDIDIDIDSIEENDIVLRVDDALNTYHLL